MHSVTSSGLPVASKEHEGVTDAKDDEENVETTSEAAVTPAVTMSGMTTSVPEVKISYTLPRLDPKTMPYAPSNRPVSPDIVPKSFDV